MFLRLTRRRECQKAKKIKKGWYVGIQSFKGTLLLALILLSPMVAIARNPSLCQASTLIPHDPILIVGDSDFTPQNGVTSGLGRADDPYVIEGWDISAENANGIEIRNTDAHFIIRNCHLRDGRSKYKHGVYFEDVVNGRIDGVVSENNFHGIFVVRFSNGDIENCIADNNLGKGIWLWYSNNNTVEDCTARNNNFEDIHLWYSSNNKVINCTIESDDHGITIDHSDNDTVTNCIVKGNNFGVYIYSSSSSAITNCTVERNNTGIILVSSNNNLIAGCSIENNSLGIKINDSSNNNRVHHNSFVNNASQALDYCTNYWDNDYPSGGNYWSDYVGTDNYRGEDQDIAGGDGIGDTPYHVSENNLDRYPLLSPIIQPQPGPVSYTIIGIIIAVVVAVGVGALFMVRRVRRGKPPAKTIFFRSG